MKIIVPTKESRSVELKDLWTVVKDSWRIKWAMLFPFEGRFPVASSISHCQIEAVDPLRFFVLGNSWHNFENKPAKLKKFFGFPWPRTIINPVIVSAGNKHQHIREGCMSYTDERNQKVLKVKRHEIVECEYWTIFGKRRKKMYLYRAALLQHELDHMDMITTEDRWRHRVK